MKGSPFKPLKLNGQTNLSNLKNLFVSDLDGTLLNSKCTLTAYSKNTINKLIDKGLNFSIATARSWNSAAPIIKGLDLKLPVVLYNGVLVYDPIDKINIQENFLPQGALDFILETFLKAALEPILFTLNERQKPSAYYQKVSNAHMSAYINSRIVQKDSRFKQIDSLLKVKNESTITLISIGEKEPLLKVKSIVEANCDIEIHFAEDVYYKKAFWLEFTSKQSTKKSGIEFLRKHLEPKTITVFGDNLNDIPLFQAADHCYATDNARQELKAIASGVIGSCDVNAVSKFIKKAFSVD